MRPTIVIFSIFSLFLINQSFAQGGWQWAASHGGDVSSTTEVVKHLQTDRFNWVFI